MTLQPYLVVTAVTADLYDDYLHWHRSIRRHYSGKIVVADLGLTAWQRATITEELLDLDPGDWRNVDQWPKWFKPYIINACTAYKRLWIDVDCVILRPLDAIFSSLDERPCVVRDYFAPAICYNSPELYQRHPTTGVDTPLNSGVVGLLSGRDDRLLGAWLSKVDLCLRQPELRPLVSLYDQGALMWAMRELGIDALTERVWNWPGKRNLYDVTPQYRWITPAEPHLGGDLLEQVALDNPGASIVHYAGRPKLSDLCAVNARGTRLGQFTRLKAYTRRIFGVGLERCGTHTLAEMIRRACRDTCWVRHEYAPALAAEADLRFRHEDFRTPTFRSRLRLYQRRDCALVCDVNHRLGFFVDQLQNIKGSRFILLYRDPVELVLSRLLNHIVWSDVLHCLPRRYALAIQSLQRETSEQNQYRIKPKDFADYPYDFIGLHIWEITSTLRAIMRQFARISADRYLICRTDQLVDRAAEIARFVGGGLLDKASMRDVAATRYGAYYHQNPPAVEDWIKATVTSQAVRIRREIGAVYREFDLPLETSMVL